MKRASYIQALAALTLALSLAVCAPGLAAGKLRREERRDEKKAAQKARNLPKNPAPMAPKNAVPPNNGAKPVNPAENPRAAGLPPAWLERLQDMPPGDQERFLNNNARFRNMTPEQQARIRQNLQQWNQLSPPQRQEMRNRQKVWASLTPQEREYVRDTILPRWQNMLPERKAVVSQRLRQLQGLDDAQRQAKLNDPAFVEGLNPDEQEMLRSLSRLRVGAGDAPGGGL
jgi:hypothetical protein